MKNNCKTSLLITHLPPDLVITCGNIAYKDVTVFLSAILNRGMLSLLFLRGFFLARITWLPYLNLANSRPGYWDISVTIAIPSSKSSSPSDWELIIYWLVYSWLKAPGFNAGWLSYKTFQAALEENFLVFLLSRLDVKWRHDNWRGWDWF